MAGDIYLLRVKILLQLSFRRTLEKVLQKYFSENIEELSENKQEVRFHFSNSSFFQGAIWGDAHMTSTLREWGKGGGEKAKMGCYRTQGVGGQRVFCKSNLYFFVKENWIFAMTRRHAEPNNILLTRHLSFDSDFRL